MWLAEGRQFATPHEALREAVNVVGSQAAMARLLGISQPSVWKWLDRSKQLPAEYVRAVEAATGIPKEQLRPDLYDPGIPGADSSACAGEGTPA